MGNLKSRDWYEGFTTALVWVSDIFESHSKAFSRRRLLNDKEIQLILNIIDACIRRRETLSDVGPRRMNLYIRPNRSVDLKEK